MPANCKCLQLESAVSAFTGGAPCLLESSVPAPLSLSLSQGSRDQASCPNALTSLSLFSMPRLACCALFTNLLLATGSGLKVKTAKGDEVNSEPNQEEEKEVGGGGGGWSGMGEKVRMRPRVMMVLYLGPELQRSVEQVQT